MQSKVANIKKELDRIIIETSTTGHETVQKVGNVELITIEQSDKALQEDTDIMEEGLILTINKAFKKVQALIKTSMNVLQGRCSAI